MSKIKIQAVAHHRNGTHGEGFHVIKFKDGKDEHIALVFDQVPGEAIRAGVIDTTGEIAFGYNSYAAECWLPELLVAIVEWEKEPMPF